MYTPGKETLDALESGVRSFLMSPEQTFGIELMMMVMKMIM